MKHELPTPTPQDRDGRDVDLDAGTLSGEAAGQLARQREPPIPAREPLQKLPSAFPAEALPTYYGLPALKEPVWKPTIPVYFYVGGLTGAAAALGAAATLIDEDRFEGLRRKARWISLLGSAASAGLLISDLGRPSRFLAMLRVFRPTSAMSVGSWVLSWSGATAAAAMLSDLPGKVGALSRGAELANGVAGFGLAGYTGVLLSGTAVPAWQLARTRIPPLFVASGMTSAACLLSLMPLNRAERKAVHRFGIAGRAAELVLSEAVESAAKRVPEVGKAFQEGPSGTAWKAAKAMTAASLLLSVIPGQPRWATRASAVLGTAGALAMRYAIVAAGRASIRNPRAGFAQQRQGLGAREVVESAHPERLERFPLPVAR